MNLTFLNRDIKSELPLEKKIKILSFYEGIDTKKKISNLIMYSFPDKHIILEKLFNAHSNLST